MLGLVSKVAEMGTRIQTVDDVVNEVVSSESQCARCSSVENELSSAGVLFQTFRCSILCQMSVIELFEIEYCRGHCASAGISCVFPC